MTPPVEAVTEAQVPSRHGKPPESARWGGSPVRSASTYPGSWTVISWAADAGEGAWSATPAIGHRASESAIQAAFLVVSKSWVPSVYAGA